MRSSTKLASVVCLFAMLIAGCGVIAQQRPGQLVIRGARIAGPDDAPLLALGLDCKLSGPMQDALDHGIPLTLRIRIEASRWRYAPNATTSEHRVELRYFPLSRRYQMRDLDTSADVRSFATPGYLFAGLNSLRLSLPATFSNLPTGTSLRVGARLEIESLPGALRLPAVFEPAWRLSAAEYAWQPAG